jgi:PKD repeat protein
VFVFEEYFKQIILKQKQMKTKLLLCSLALAGLQVMNATQVQAQNSCQAGFTPTVSTTTVIFTNTSNGGSGTTKYSWDFGDATYATTVTPQTQTHTYAYSGVYTVCLFMADSDSVNGGCWNNFCDTIVITGGANPPCHAYFQSTLDSTNQQQQGISFHDLSAYPVSWFWNFGDGNTSIQQNPVHLYANAGSYSVCLTVVNSFHDTCTYCSSVNYYPCNQVVGFTFNNMNNPQIVFTNTSTGGYTPIYSWDFGDGTYSNLQNPIHTYAYNGTYQVCLTLGDSMQSCYSTSCDTVVVTGGVNQPCSASFKLVQDSANTGSLSWNVYPNVTGTAPFTYLWNFGDGTSSTQQYPSHTYATVGHYIICLTITDATGCSSSTCDSTYKKVITPMGGLMQYLKVVNPNNAAGIQENSVSVNSVFPNPANDLLEVTLSQLVNGNIMITDMTGREVYQEKINTSNVKVNVSTLPVGFYNLSIVSETKTLHSKILISR